jgi:hypothetical protein
MDEIEESSSGNTSSIKNKKITKKKEKNIKGHTRENCKECKEL